MKVRHGLLILSLVLSITTWAFCDFVVGFSTYAAYVTALLVSVVLSMVISWLDFVYHWKTSLRPVSTAVKIVSLFMVTLCNNWLTIAVLGALLSTGSVQLTPEKLLKMTIPMVCWHLFMTIHDARRSTKNA